MLTPSGWGASHFGAASLPRRGALGFGLPFGHPSPSSKESWSTTSLVLRASVRIAILIFVKIQISKYMTAKALDPIKVLILLIPKTLKGNTLHQYKQTITLNPIQREVIVGTLLGDAVPCGHPLQKGKPTLNVRFAQNLARAEYVQHLYEIFSGKHNFVGTPPRVQKIRGGGAQDRKQIWFQTYGHPDFKFYDQLFYPIHEYKGSRRKKRVA